MSEKFIGIDPRDVRNITCIGGGPIGAGWAAWFLARGYGVTAYLHDMAEEAVFTITDRHGLDQPGIPWTCQRCLARQSLLHQRP